MATTQTKQKTRRSQTKDVASPRTSRKQTRSPKRTTDRAQTPLADKLASWADLQGEKSEPSKRKVRSDAGSWISLPHFWGWLWVIAAGYILYVAHVQATKNAYDQVQLLQAENLDLNLRSNQLKAELDGATGPGRIFERARELGLVEGYTYGSTIMVQAE